jgi:hypothetical protein
VIRGSNDGLPIEAFVHRWKTQRTETYSDSEGRSQTRTVTENHSEILTAIMMAFLGSADLDRRRMGRQEDPVRE